MNYSTFKKIGISAMFLLFGLGSFAQTQNSSAKVFGGRSQYRTWSLGLNAGALTPVTVFGGTKDFSDADLN